MSAAGTVTGGIGKQEARPPRRVVLLSESSGLAALLEHLLDDAGRLRRFPSLRAALERDGLADADTVVLDLPHEGADTAIAHARHHWKGNLVVLAERGHHPQDVPMQPAWTLLTRPFSAQDLAAALGLPGIDPAGLDGAEAAAGAAGQGGWPAAAAGGGVRGAARRATAWALAVGDRVATTRPVDRALRALAAFGNSWRARRRVRVVGFSLVALVAFTIAFAVAARDRCGPGCDGFGTGFSPIPTVAPGAPGVPATTAPRRLPPSTTAPADGPGTGAFGGVSGRPATSTTARATTTSRRPDPTRPTSPPTRPPTTPTTAPPVTPTPPTTAPPTTQ